MTVLEEDIERSKKEKKSYWICKCDCGNVRSIRGTSLNFGEAKSCGCLQKEKAAKIGKNNTKNLLGLKVGKLTVIKQVESKNNRA